MTHKGGAPKWEIIKDDSAPSKPNVFAQVSNDATGGRFPLAVYEKASLKDGTLSVKFKAISGSADQAAGLVWRYKDPDNYYIVRANALEDNVVLVQSRKRRANRARAQRHSLQDLRREASRSEADLEHSERGLPRQRVHGQLRWAEAL